MKIKTLSIVFLAFAIGWCGFSCESSKPNSPEIDLQSAVKILDEVHTSFNKKDTAGMYRNYTNKSEFYGTDATENWDMTDFKEYMLKYISSPGKGPNYRIVWRKLTPSSDGNVLWGVEELDYPSLKMPVRSTVVLEKIDGSWKVQLQQWHFLIKNETTGKVDQWQ